MQNEVTFAGFGGQGIMMAGKLLAYAGMEEGKNVIWLPSYGPEMRGGTAYCVVIVSNEEISSPIIKYPECCVVMNRPSLDKFAPMIRAGGTLIINSSLIDVTSDRKDIDILHVPANEIALECGTGKAANMVALGAYVGKLKNIDIESVRKMVEKEFREKPKFIKVNLDALNKGYSLAKSSK
jgi:2-oxoglutarate ferredoxin oxidoreductase subunit gamma